MIYFVGVYIAVRNFASLPNEDKVEAFVLDQTQTRGLFGFGGRGGGAISVVPDSMRFIMAQHKNKIWLLSDGIGYGETSLMPHNGIHLNFIRTRFRLFLVRNINSGEKEERLEWIGAPSLLVDFIVAKRLHPSD